MVPSNVEGVGANVDAAKRQPVTVLAVDDQQVFLRALGTLIAATPEFEQIGEARSGAEAVALAKRTHPALVLLDVHMPGMDGFETARRLAAVDPGIAIVLISIDPLPERADEPTPPKAAFVRKQDLSVRTLHETWSALSSSS